MEARQNNNPVDPIEAQNQGAEVPPPPSKKVPTQYVAIGAVLAMSVATTFAMRKYGMGEGVKFQHTDVRVADLESPLVDNAKFGRVMDRLATSNTPMQVPVDKIDKNPFLLGRESAAVTEGPAPDRSVEIAAREAEQNRLAAERRLSDLNVAFARLTLHTVMAGGRVSAAKINNEIVGVNDPVDGIFVVTAITPDGVTLQAEEHEFFLAVNSMVGPRNTGGGGRYPSSSIPPRRP